jgi:HEAT repeat protein
MHSRAESAMVCVLVFLFGRLVYCAEAVGDQSRGETTALLIKQLSNADVDIRKKAADRLKSQGPDAQSAVPALLSALRDREASIRLAAASALIEIDPDQTNAVIASMVRDLKDSDPHTRWKAIKFLESLDVPPKSCCEVIAEALTDDASDVREAAEQLLRRTGVDEKCVPALLKATGHQDARVR